MRDLEARMYIENKYEWQKWQQEIPFISFPSEWLVKATPPFGGAIIRYNIKHKDYDSFVSVYLDCYDELGIVGQPYWEIYPNKMDDVDRVLMNNTKELINLIKEALQEQKQKRTV